MYNKLHILIFFKLHILKVCNWVNFDICYIPITTIKLITPKILVSVDNPSLYPATTYFLATVREFAFSRILQKWNPTFFFVCLLSCSVIIVRSIHVVACFKSKTFLLLRDIPLYGHATFCLTIHPEGCLCCFQF